MTVAANSSRLQPATDGVTTSFVCSFAILERSHLRVYVDSELQSEGADYSLVGEVDREGLNGFESGFSVVMATAPAASEVLTIYRVIPRTQLTRYYGGDRFRAEVPERTWDKLTMMAQDISELLGLTVKPGLTSPDVGGGGAANVIPVGNPVFFGLQVDNTDGTYEAVEVEWDGYTWYAPDQPILTDDLGEANGCQDPSVGDVVIGFPLVNSASGVTYRFQAADPCDDNSATAGPEQSSPYYRLTDCDASAPDIVTSADLTRLVGRVVNVGGVCYTVSEESDGTGAVTGVAIATAWSDCAACDAGTGPSLPELPNIYAQLARCSDDVLVDYWLPEVQFGLPGDEDLTKIYGYLGVCYYVSNVRADTPGILFPSGAATVWDDCQSCRFPCLVGDVVQTVSAVVAGLTTLSAANGTYTYSSRNVTASDISSWSWALGGQGNVHYWRNCDTVNETIFAGTGCETVLAPGQGAIIFESAGGSLWLASANSVVLSSTGQVTGSASFDGSPCDGGAADETFTVTIS